MTLETSLYTVGAAAFAAGGRAGRLVRSPRGQSRSDHQHGLSGSPRGGGRPIGDGRVGEWQRPGDDRAELTLLGKVGDAPQLVRIRRHDEEDSLDSVALCH